VGSRMWLWAACGRTWAAAQFRNIPARMRHRARAAALLLLLCAAGGLLSACGTQAIQMSKSSAYYNGAVIFRDHCSGCHTLDTVGAAGSATSITSRLKTNGPNFNQRKEQYNQVIYAIENGGFSGAIMPENVVVGHQAQEVAQFLTRYSGLKATNPPTARVTPQSGAAVSSAPGNQGGTPVGQGGSPSPP
jgi:mono/diheme cytochrome c family protein